MKHHIVLGKDNQAFVATLRLASFTYFSCAIIELNSLLALIHQDLYQLKSRCPAFIVLEGNSCS